MKLRLDIWLHRARLFKSRTQATTACRESKIMINDTFADAGDTVQEGDAIKIRSQGLYREYRVLEAADVNLSKQEARRMYEEITDPATVEKFRQVTESNREWRQASKKESGRRPTKKKRRDMDKIRGR